MFESERAKLKEAAEAGDTTSIAINADGKPARGCFIPWERTVSAYNMKTPEITIASEDLRDSEVMDDLKKCRLIGLYCFTPLDSYEFIAEFPTLRDLFIRHGDNICNLSFTRGLSELTMLYLENARLDNLQPLIDIFNENQELPFMPRAICMGFYQCSVADTSALQEVEFITSELLVWPVEGDTRERWRMRGYPRPGTFRFYEQK